MSVEKTLSDLIDAQERVAALNADLKAASEERDRLLVQARKTGASAAELATLTGVNRSRVYQILDRAGLRP